METYKYFLKSLLVVKSPKQRRNILHFATREEIIALSEIVLNYIEGNIKVNLSSDKFKIFSKHKNLFRILGYKGKISWLKRKKAAQELGKTLILFLSEILPKIYDEI
jgi:hypothetical protein